MTDPAVLRPATGAEAPRAPRFTQAVGLVAGREISSRVRSKSFLVSTALLALAVLASIVIGGFAAQNTEPPQVAVVGQSAAVADRGLDVVAAGDRAEAERMLRDGDVDAIVVPGGDAASTTVIGLDSAPDTVVQMLSVPPQVEILNPDAPNPFLAYFVALGFGIVFLMAATTFGSTIAYSVVEEKQTRVVEILLSTVSSRAMLTGKVVGNSLMAFGQILLIAAVAIIGLLVTGQDVVVAGLGPSIAWFVVFFLVGFVMLAAMFAAAAALVSRSEDIGSVTSPITMLVMIPYFLVVFFNDNSLVLTIMSYVPFSAPVGMPMRIFLEQAAWWEPLVSLAVLVASTALVILIGERVYSNSLLRMGARVKLGEALRG
ncbi:ABC transporter permease [Agromyces archimandritae]|uniref:ABC transporter permease n=1 Tax=Agromyces archimandritae TaxID=2781962 RepID=A0A975FQN6_9MICO|nr:ABC transporter permease [Agromyces archimandritae]QTX05938.1 ABC transporter permease [Agromyces archimandritae]